MKFKKILPLTLLSLAILPGISPAAVIGFLGNFDVINDTGKTAHGFEIELEGLHASDITDTFGGEGRGFPSGRGFDPSTSVERYGAPTITEYSNGVTFGVKVTYQGLFNGSSWDYGTPSGTFITPGDNCWSGGGVGYSATTPCDHFGVGTSKNPTKTTYSWLVETPTPGVLSNGVVTLPAPAWAVIPDPLPIANPPADLVIPADPIPVPAVPPVLVAEIKAPEPIQLPDLEPQFGEAIWVKVFTTELETPVALEELVADNNKVKLAVTETEWQLLQTDPGNPLAGKLESGYAAPVGPNAASILRRYEFYKYAGDYKVVDHEALPMISDSHPDPSEIGTYLGAQNVGANLVDPLQSPPPAIVLGTTNLPATGTIGVFYTGSSVATGGEGALTWSATGLPTGVSISSAGTISGTPSATGTFSAVVLTVNDTLGQTATVNGSVTINPPADFTVDASSSLTVKRGSSVSNTVTIGSLYSFNSSVGLTISGLPKNAKAAFTPSSITGSGSSILKVTTASTTPRGTSTLTITAKSGILPPHTKTVTLTVQ